MLILRLLSQREMHGYEIMEEMRKGTGGLFAPTAGTVYPILRTLEEKGHVKSAWTKSRGRRRKRVYTITSKGVKTLASFDALTDQARESMRDNLLKASNILELERPPAGKRLVRPFNRLGDGQGWFMVMQGASRASSDEERIRLLKKAKGLLAKRIEFLREKEDALGRQIGAISRRR